MSKPRKALNRACANQLIQRHFYSWAVHKGFTPARHHRLIIREIERFLVNDDDVLLLFAPPGSAKSTYTSILLPSFYLARWPKRSILAATHSEPFAARWGRRVRSDVILEGHVLGITLQPGAAANDRWQLVSGGEYYGVGANTGIGGFRADLGLADDLFGTKQDAMSEATRASRWEWWLNDFSARLKPTAKRILMNTRWHMADVAGRVLEQIESGVIKGKVITLRARAEADDILGRPIGAYLWEDPTGYNYGQFLRQREQELPEADWQAMYQQRPVAETGNYFKLDWIHEISVLPPRHEMSFYGGSDYAVTSAGGDYTVHVVLGVDTEGRLYLVDMWRGQTSSDIWVETLADLIKKWKPVGWAEEQGQIKSGVGPFKIKRLREKGAYCAFEEFPTRGDKATRAQSIRGRMAQGGLYLLKEAAFKRALLSELLTFPVGINDDIPDALGLAGQLLDRMVGGYKKKLPEPRKPDAYIPHERNDSSGFITL